MAPPPKHPGALRNILLATDLSARSDRALDRAAALTQVHDARLLVLHVVEPGDIDPATSPRALPSWRRPDVAGLTRQRIRQALRADLGDALERASVMIHEGDPAKDIERVASEEGVDLIVAGIARESPFSSRPVVLGKTLEQLLRRLPAPLLIVRNRPRDAYQHIVVTTDFSVPSAHALQTAAGLFPGQPLHVLHVFEPDPALLADSEPRAAEMRRFLESIYLPEADRRRLVPIIEPGSPAEVLREYVQLHGADLVVMGTRGRGAVMEAVLGSTAKSMLAVLPCDALVVRGPRG